MTAIVFKPIFPLLWVVIVSLLIAILFFWLEIKRKQKLLLSRLAAVLIAVICLAMLVLRPEQSALKSSNIIILTEKYSKPVLDSLLSVDPASQVYVAKKASPINNATSLDNYRELINLKGNIDIVGLGIPEYAIQHLDTTSVQFYPSKIPFGFTYIDSQKTFAINQTDELKIGFNSDKKSYTVKLSTSGIVQDSVIIKRVGEQSISFSLKPKVAGLLSYSLTAIDSLREIVFSEDVPIQVLDQKKLSILFLCNYPSAEIRFLKNFLETENHKLTLRYKISQDKYRSEFINTPQRNLGRINSSSLENFDLIITDATSLASLSNSEQKEIQESIRLGLGMIVQISESTLEKNTQQLTGLRTNKIKSDSATLILNRAKLKAPASPVTISSDKNIFNVLQEPSGRIVSGYTQHGLGRTGFTLLNQTYSLELSGKRDLYADLWTSLINATTKRDVKKYDLKFTTPFPHYCDEPIDFQIIATDKKPTLLSDSTDIPITEDQLIQNVWHGRLWSSKPGWNSIKITEDSTNYNFFVSDEHHNWKNLRIFNQQLALSKVSSSSEKPVEQFLERPIPLYIFFLLFILSTGFLWLAPKL